MSNCNKVTDSILVGAKKVIDNIIPPKDKGIYSGNVLNNKHEYFEVKKLFSELKTEAEKAKAVKNLGLEKYTAKTLLSLLENDMDFTTKEETNKAIEEKTTELKTEINNLIENLPKDTVIITNPVNAGNITKPGIYTNVVSGRPATAVDDGDTSYTIIAGGDEAKTLLAVGNISGKVWSRSNKGNWTLNIQLYLNAEGYNADLCTKPGIYDPVVLGRPEGSESDERYFLYVSPYGGQIIFSRRNSGKIYHRLGAGHPWVPVSQNDVIILQALESSLNNYGQSGYYPASELEGLTGYIDEPSMGEVYAGYNNLDITSFNATKLIDITPNTIIAIDVFYRKGEKAEQYPYDSDAYVYISNSPEKGHGIELLLSDYIKVPALGSISTTVTDLNSAHELFYTNKIRIYIKSTSIKNLPAYLHIAGDFSEKRSWLCIGDIYLYEHINIINTVEGLIDSYNFLTEEDGIIPIDLSPYINDDTQELPHTSRDTQEFSSARHYQYYFNNTPCRFIEYEGPRFVGKPVQYFLVFCYYNRSLKKYLYINFINWHYTEITDLTNDPDNNYLFGIDRLGSGDVATINGKSIVNGGNIEIPTKISLLENDLVLTEEQKELLKGPQGPAGPAGEIPNIEQLQTDIATTKTSAQNAERKAENLSRKVDSMEGVERDNSLGKGVVNLKKNIQRVQSVKIYENALPVDAVTTSAHNVVNGSPVYGDAQGNAYVGSHETIVLNTSKKAIYGNYVVHGGTWGRTDAYYYGFSKASEYALEVDKVYKGFVGGALHFYRWDGTTFIVDDKEEKELNTLTQDAVSTPNTIYNVLYDMDLNGATIKPASGSVIRYQGGMLKNGTLDFSNGDITIECPAVQFFENINIRNVDGTQDFIDVWFDEIFSNHNPVHVRRIQLTKDHLLNNQHVSMQSSVDSLHIEGNGHALSWDTSHIMYAVIGISCKTIVLSNVALLTADSLSAINALFNCFNFKSNNVTYRGSNRLAVNWSYSNIKENNALELFNCKLYGSDFLFEGRFDNVEIESSTLDFIDYASTVSEYDILSIGANPTLTDGYCSGRINNSQIMGAWEITSGSVVENVYQTYHEINITNSEVAQFCIGTRGNDRPKGNCVCNLTNTTLNNGGNYGGWSYIKELYFKDCVFNINFYYRFSSSPLASYNIDSIILDGCSFYRRGFRNHTNINNYTLLSLYTDDIDKRILKMLGCRVFCDEEIKEHTVYNIGFYTLSNKRIGVDDIKNLYTFSDCSLIYANDIGNFNVGVTFSGGNIYHPLPFNNTRIVSADYAYITGTGLTLFKFNVVNSDFIIHVVPVTGSLKEYARRMIYDSNRNILVDTGNLRVPLNLQSWYMISNYSGQTFWDINMQQMMMWDGNRVVRLINGEDPRVAESGTSAKRPVYTNKEGFRYFDKSLGKPIFLSAAGKGASISITINAVHSVDGNITIKLNDYNRVVALPKMGGVTDVADLANQLYSVLTKKDWNYRGELVEFSISGAKITITHRAYTQLTNDQISVEDTGGTGLGYSVTKSLGKNNTWVDAFGNNPDVSSSMLLDEVEDE